MRNSIVALLAGLSLSMSLVSSVNATPYTDDALIGDWSKESVQVLTDLGIMVGYPDGSFQPQWAINREEYAVSLLKGLEALEVKMTLATENNNNALYNDLLDQQVMLIEALTAIDELKAIAAVEKNNWVGISMNYNPENDTTDNNGYLSLDGKIQVVRLSDTFAISVRPFVDQTGEAGAAATVDASLLGDKITVGVGAGYAGAWSNNAALAGDSQGVGYAQGTVEYNLSKTSGIYVNTRVPFTGDNKGDVNVGTGLSVSW